MDHLTTLDHLARLWVVTHRVHAVNGMMRFASTVGEGGAIWWVVGAVLTALRRMSVRQFVQLAAAMLLAALATNYVIKPAVHRQRPFVDTPTIHVLERRPRDASFPSAHAANAFAGTFALSRFVPEGRAVWWIGALVIAFSRVYVGVHYPLDVLGGAFVGAACGILVISLGRLVPPCNLVQSAVGAARVRRDTLRAATTNGRRDQ